MFRIQYMFTVLLFLKTLKYQIFDQGIQNLIKITKNYGQ